jgi:transcriptional regulator with XRE-family HTH domain
MKSPEDKHLTLTLVKANESRHLKKLNPRHLHAILLDLLGYKLKEIAEKTGLTPKWISRIIRSNLAQELIAEYRKLLDLEFQAQAKKVVRTIEDGLDHKDINVRLKAADRWLRIYGKFLGDDLTSTRITAEDVVQRMMESQQAE